MQVCIFLMIGIEDLNFLCSHLVFLLFFSSIIGQGRQYFKILTISLFQTHISLYNWYSHYLMNKAFFACGSGK